ncbi:hybrid sensor histidine kinase/response regulator [Thalassotalea mangrovi]|uniref:Hybrid sensor histidine kinase/response regulator n=1 Tax=Thalassotalea mangrovi TaxID=2572245 RepID=A0A4U1B3N2_9GAMM|nr:hybrid sensor histidine kinase/response regulator [Thalassotalea mangrovi]TKB44391.1 hybrid sensor histidine kinase/response regulator [Thalassotalea mangrovi]
MTGKTNQDKPQSPPVVLIVDDEPGNIDLASSILRPQYLTKAATNAKTALKVIEADSNIDLILLDVMMPHVNGFELCKQLKSNEATTNIPIIFLTAKSQVEDITQGFKLGAVDYITKPLQPDVLSARVNTHVQLHQSQKLLNQQVKTLEENARLREDIERLTHHDLKGPLGVILFELNKINDKAIANSIEESVTNVLNMINNSLDIFKIENGTYPLDPDMVDLKRTCTRAIKSVRYLSRPKNIAIKLTQASDDLYALGEELLCLSIVNNLLKNAVEASPDDQTIHIEISENSSMVQISIENQGAIPEELRDTIFEKYATSNLVRGSGLGAYSAKLMTEAQNGHIKFAIIDNDKTRFTVTLPKY